MERIDNEEAPFLELRRVNVARGERVVLHDVNLTIRAGEHVAILGPNGCGKSTLILTMTCQIYPIVQAGHEGAHLWPRALGSDRAAQAFRRGGGAELPGSCRASVPP